MVVCPRGVAGRLLPAGEGNGGAPGAEGTWHAPVAFREAAGTERLAPTDGAAVSATVRWAMLIAELVRLARALPPVAPLLHRRRIGEPPRPPAEVDGPRDPAGLEAVTGHVLGLLSRCGALAGLASAASVAGADDTVDTVPLGADGLEARLMVALVDHLLGWHLAWAGRDDWRRRPLAAYLFGRASLIDPATRRELHARLAAGDPRFTRVLPALLGLGLGPELFPDDQARRLVALHPAPPPLGPAPSLPRPPVTQVATAEGPAAGARAGRLWVAGLLALATALLGWQYVVWQEAVVRLSARLAGSG